MAKQKKKKTKKQKAWRLIRIQIFLIALVLLGLGYYFLGGSATKVAEMKKEAEHLVAASSVDTFRTSETSEVYDVNGKVIARVKGERDVYYLPIDEIPVYARQAMVTIEDKKFYSHHGIDYRAVVRAVIAMIENGKVTQGASTITQQLARDVFLSQDRTWERKIEEIYIAYELEKKYSKDQILEFYMNNIYFKNGYYGIEAAAQGYFSKSVGELSLSEVAFLCAIPNNPTYYDPLTHFKRTMKRRNRILKQMMEDRVISQKTYETAKKEKVELLTTEIKKRNFVETYTYYSATRILMALDGFEFKTSFEDAEEEQAYNKAYEEAYDAANSKLFTGGYRIYTSFDLSMQRDLQSAVDDGLAAFTETGEDGIYTLQGAAVCIDNVTGLVRAMVGGRAQKVSGYTLNRAYQSYRQPGSAIKPVLIYTPELERGYTADTMVEDTEIEDGPSNADGYYEGKITLRKAVEKSKNTVAYKLLDELTPEVGLSYLEAMNFARLDKDDNRLSIALGGFTRGVSPLEMAKAYATLENDGKYRDPGCIIKITGADGNLIYQADQTEAVIYKTNAARAMTDILEGVLTEGTGKGLGISQMPCAGKTGTTNDNKDGWFVGYTRYYTTSVWVGYDQPKKLPGLTGASYPGEIWHNFMEHAHEGLTPLAFLDPTEIMDTNEYEVTEESLFDTPDEEIGEPDGSYDENYEPPEESEGAGTDEAGDAVTDEAGDVFTLE